MKTKIIEVCMQPVIKWTGSKRLQAQEIASFFPEKYNKYYEPFIGGGSMLYTINPEKGICGDICTPLIEMWEIVRDDPHALYMSYKNRWERLVKNGNSVYFEARERFNKEKSPHDLFFLTRTCMNGFIRFNKNGEFNVCFHYGRNGINPETLYDILYDWSDRIQNITFMNEDYITTTSTAKEGDIIYLDPPYFHTKGMYSGGIDYNKFIEYLTDLNQRNVKWLLSYDGKVGQDDLTVNISENLYKRHKYINSGNSCFRKFANKEIKRVFDSLYMNF